MFSTRKRSIFRGLLFALLPAALLAGCVVSNGTDADRAETVPQAAPAAKNVIIMISDGWGYYDAAAAGIFHNGEAGTLNYESFPVHFAMSTYPAGGGYDGHAAWGEFDYVKRGATDSAAAGTALATGRKTYNGAIGVVGSPEEPQNVPNILEAAEKLGKATGVVTSVEWSHATPAAFVAHNQDRDNYEDIARQMINESAAEVIMGCGHPLYDRNSLTPPEEPQAHKFVGGGDTWEALAAGTAGGDSDGDGKADAWTLVETREDIRNLAAGPTPKRLCATARVETTLQQKRSGDKNAAPYEVPFTESVATLAEMTAAALNVLDDDADGFFLMVEGGAVDWASHSNQSGRMIEEELDFVNSVDMVMKWVEANSSWDETLLIVTGDHECGYLTGPGSGPSRMEMEKAGTFVEGQALADPVWKPIENRGKGVLPGMEWHSGSHTNSLIPVYAKGAGAQLLEKYADEKDPVRGRYVDNTEVAKVMFEAMR